MLPLRKGLLSKYVSDSLLCISYCRTAATELVFICLLVSTAICGPIGLEAEAAPPVCRAMMSEWFALDNHGNRPMPAIIDNMPALSRKSLGSVAQEVLLAYRQSPTGEVLRNLLPEPAGAGSGDASPTGFAIDLHSVSKTMPFAFFARGKSEGLRPLFIALHGGGSAGGKAPSPHGWAVNTREWQTQIALAKSIYPDNALYFVPRMADDNDGRWYFDYCQDAFEKVLRAAILHRNVDSNRVYLIGISEGAYTAYRLGAFMADRWAGAGSMAGGEPPRNAPPENMRNIAFRADIGEHDTMFDRVGLNRRYGVALDKLQQQDPQGFVHKINVQAGRGHGIDYRACPDWISAYERDPWPARVLWKLIKVHERTRRQFYWLAVDGEPGPLPLLLDARIAGQSVTISAKRAGEGIASSADLKLRVYLNDELLDLDRPVTVILNGRTVFAGQVARRVSVMMRSLAERGDPYYMFPAEIKVATVL